jgi:hypothetical protein
MLAFSNRYPHKISYLYPYFSALYNSSEKNIPSNYPKGDTVLRPSLVLNLICSIGCFKSKGAVILQ